MPATNFNELSHTASLPATSVPPEFQRGFCPVERWMASASRFSGHDLLSFSNISNQILTWLEKPSYHASL